MPPCMERHNWSPTSFLPKYINFSLHASVQRSTLAIEFRRDCRCYFAGKYLKLRTVPFYCHIDLPLTELNNLSMVIIEFRLDYGSLEELIINYGSLANLIWSSPRALLMLFPYIRNSHGTTLVHLSPKDQPRPDEQWSSVHLPRSEPGCRLMD